jgi:hypothetical protein
LGSAFTLYIALPIVYIKARIADWLRRIHLPTVFAEDDLKEERRILTMIDGVGDLRRKEKREG